MHIFHTRTAQIHHPLQRDAQFQALLDYLEAELRLEVDAVNSWSVMLGVKRHMRETGAETLGEYLGLLEVQPQESARLAHGILLAYTAFFRDRSAWEFLAEHVIGRLVTDNPPRQPIRIWSAGCASGEEPYSLAMLMAEEVGRRDLRKKVTIYGTDIDSDALAEARRGYYNAKRVNAVAGPLRRRYFERAQGSYRVCSDVRDSVTFLRHDVAFEPPIPNLDLVVCRHTLMYFDPETQARILSAFYSALEDGGFVFLESTDPLLGHARLFEPLTQAHPILTKVRRVETEERVEQDAPLGAGRREAVN